MRQNKVRVRFAPSPTGPLHIGGVRTALFNYIFAKQNQGDFILRIEDTDQARTVKGAEEYIIEAFKWLKIEPNEGHGFGDGDFGPYKQSLRKDIYKQYADQLVKQGHAYIAFDTPEDIEQMRKRSSNSNLSSYNYITRESMKNSLTLSDDEVNSRLEKGEPYVIRLKVTRNQEVKFSDMVRGNLLVNSSALDDKVLFKSDGMPTYHLANVVDDHLMQISHVIRGEEWLPSLPVHILLYEYLGFDLPYFAHLPLILRPDGNGKLSKRDGDQLGFPVFPLNWKDEKTGEIYSGFRERGFFPEALINILVMLGWSPGTEEELFGIESVIKLFSIEKIAKSGAKFNPQKANWFNQQYLKNISNEVLFDEIKSKQISLLADSSDEYLMKVLVLFKERMVFIDDLAKEAEYMFKDPKVFDKQIIEKKVKPEALDFVESFLNRLSHRKEEVLCHNDFEEEWSDLVEQMKVKPNIFLPSIRFILTGVLGGPPIFDIMELLGKDKVIARIKFFLSELEY